jgi:subtilisin family serine protease
MMTVVAGCTKPSRMHQVLAPELLQGRSPSSQATLLLLHPDARVLADARAAGLMVKGETVVEVRGAVSALARLRTESEHLDAVLDQPIKAERAESGILSSEETFDHQTMYLAKEEFGLSEWLKNRPQSDGRGVVVGVMDDGIAPDLMGLQQTSTGERKILALGKPKSALDAPVAAYTREAFPDAFYQGLTVPEGAAVYGATIQEKTAFNTEYFLDLNRNGTRDVMAAAVVNQGNQSRICVDANVNHQVDAGECFGTFASSGDYGYWDAAKIRAAWAEFDAQNLTLSISAGEFANADGDVDYDSHGEGVATVMAGHQVGGQSGQAFDGLAPGAKVVSYDLSEPGIDGVDGLYTAGTFLRGYEWLGQQGAEVINTSYSFFFYSAETQAFFNKAVAALIAKYRFVMSFSAGNNGPGLGSFNRGLMYPDHALVAGAFVSKELDEYVHGVTGLPEEGRVVFYSSRGPAPDGGAAPTVISPLASLTHSTAGEGYQAFNGTSSASPALAGLAAVLVSAIKQEGLPVDPMAVTHAIRASGRRLPGIPYVDQGHGLPEVSRAFALYQAILRSERFAYVSAKAADGSGIFVKASQLSGDFEVAVALTGKKSPVQDVATIDRLLVPTTMVSNVSWLRHPAHGWISVGSSKAYVAFQQSDVLAALEKSGSGELTAELSIQSTATGEVLGTVPVTIVDDRPITGTKVLSVSLGAEEGQRVHVGIDEGTAALELTVDEMNLDGAIAAMIYDTNGIKGSRIPLKNGRKYVIPTATKGWNQLTLMRWGGTSIAAKGRVSVRPIQLALANAVTDPARPMMSIRNAGAEISGVLAVLPLRDSFFSATKIGTLGDVQSWELPVPRVGSIWSRAGSRSYGNVSYVSSQCMQWLQAVDGSIVASIPTDGSVFDVTDEHVQQAASMQLRCASFEVGANPSAGTRVEWNVDIRSFAKRDDGKSWASLATVVPARFARGMTTMAVPAVLGSGVELFHRAGVDGGELALGTLKPLAP